MGNTETDKTYISTASELNADINEHLWSHSPPTGWTIDFKERLQDDVKLVHGQNCIELHSAQISSRVYENNVFHKLPRLAMSQRTSRMTVVEAVQQLKSDSATFLHAHV